ncbi:GDSL-type esterase/lipase family protein [Deltaproteobacteria bacterium]|nr:GDSL-type esterase/lipase family protein [Deltaproteobacteria bacterium]
MKAVKIALGCVFIVIIIWFLIPTSWEIRNADPEGESIICFGDSLAYGTGAKEGMDYPSQLSGLIGREILNTGVPGDTTATALDRLDGIIDRNPRIVLITLGGNDLKNRINKEVAFNNLELIIGRIQDHGALVVLGGIDVPLYGRGFGEAYEELAKKTGSVLIPNIFKGIMGRPSLMSDPIHPNSEGYTIMAQHFYNAVEPYLKGEGTSPGE